MYDRRMMLVVMLLMFCAGPAQAEEARVTISGKLWYNWWEQSTGGSSTQDYGSSVMVGPAIAIRFPTPFFIGVSYLKTTDDYVHSVTTTEDNLWERSDLDATFGYMFSPHFGMFLGYKSLDSAGTYYNENTAVRYVFLDRTMKGPAFGIVGNVPLWSGGAFYGNLAFLLVEYEGIWHGTRQGEVWTSDMAGGVIEGGFAQAFGDVVSLNIGFKWQSISGDIESNRATSTTTLTNTFYGVTGGLNFTF